MNPEVWRKVSDVFSDCLVLPESQRTAFLAKLETTDPEVTKEIRKLLASYAQDDQFLEKPAIQEAAGIFDTVEQAAKQGASSELEPFAPELRMPRSRSKSRRSTPAFWWLMGGNVVVLGCFVFALWAIGVYGSKTARVGWRAESTVRGHVVTVVDNPGPAAGILQVGDEVLDTERQAIRIGQLAEVTPGQTYTLRIARNGETRELVLKKEILPFNRWNVDALSYIVVSLTFFITAIVLSVLRPGPGIITLAWAALAGEALTLLCMLVDSCMDFLPGPAFVFFSGMILIDGPHLAFAFQFYSRMFPGERRGRLSAFLVALFYAWAVGCSVLFRIVISRAPQSPMLYYLWVRPRLWYWVVKLDSAFYLVAPLSICLAVGYSYFRARNVEERRRARWIAAGSLAGILPYLLLRFAETVGIQSADYSGPLGILPAALIPVATGYAILKHRLFDIHVVLRRGLQYLVARNILRIVLALPALALLYSLVTNANRTVGEVVLHNSIFIALVVLIAIVLRFRQRLGAWLDRRFFREGYKQEQILLALIDDLRNLDSIPEMGERVALKLTAALHPESVYFFYHSPKEHAFVRGFGTDERADGLQIPEGSALPALLTNSDRAMSVESFPSDGVPLMSWSWLYTLRIDLAVPMNRADGSPVGFLLLGRKKSEEPYSPTDRSLLLGLARAMAVSCENLLLQERVLNQQRSNEQMRARVEGISTAWLQECPDCGRCFDSSVRTCSIDGTDLVLSSPVHRLLDNRYRLDRVLGRGGMGTVFEALDLRLNRQVAIKIVQAGRTTNPAWLRRFTREARALAKLNHENIVLTHDFGVVEDEVAYLTMEFVSGTTLRAELDRGPMSPSAAAEVFRQLLEGVKAAHVAGIVHRDLKPENVLMTRMHDGLRRVKIADFGIAKWQVPDVESASLTLPGTIVGSLRYMSPEQLDGLPVDARSDLFSIGVMAFEALTGKPPFAGSSYAERMASIAQGSERLGSALSSAPALRETLCRCLARERNDRFSTAAELQTELIPRIADSRVEFHGKTEECA